MKRLIISIFCSVMLVGWISAQDQNGSQKKKETYDDIKQRILLVELPPLDTLFASARVNNARMLASEMEIEVAVREMKSERNEWWDFLRFFGAYQYGLMASLVDITSGGVPINPQYSRQAQNWWNVGVTLSIPLVDIIDRPNRIKKERARVKLMQYTAEIKFDEIKTEIAQAYSEAVLSLTVSKALTERYSFANAQYEIAEKDFLAGRMGSSELAIAKSNESVAYSELQKELSNLIHYITSLEILSKIKILK